MAHILCLFGAITGLIRDLIISPLRTHDLAAAPQVHPQLCAGSKPRAVLRKRLKK